MNIEHCVWFPCCTIQHSGKSCLLSTDHYKRKCTTYIFTVVRNCSSFSDHVYTSTSYRKSSTNDLPRPSTVWSLHCRRFFLAVCIVISTWKRKDLWSCVLFFITCQPCPGLFFIKLACATKHQVGLDSTVGVEARWKHIFKFPLLNSNKRLVLQQFAP